KCIRTVEVPLKGGVVRVITESCSPTRATESDCRDEAVFYSMPQPKTNFEIVCEPACYGLQAIGDIGADVDLCLLLILNQIIRRQLKPIVETLEHTSVKFV